MDNNQSQISTEWLLESSNSSNKMVINAIYLVFCAKTQSKGSGFAIKSNFLVTNYHVVKGCEASDIIAISNDNKKIEFTNLVFDENRDIAILTPKQKIDNGLDLNEETVETEVRVSTWGHPLAYNGPSPVLSIGYVAGFNAYQKDKESKLVKRYIINGALNPGNSGGPLFVAGDSKVIGIVVAKHAPITNFLRSALEGLAQNTSGVIFTATNDRGIKQNFVESQIVAMLLEHQKKLTQVMLGEAIAISELADFLREQKLIKN